MHAISRSPNVNHLNGLMVYTTGCSECDKRDPSRASHPLHLTDHYIEVCIKFWNHRCFSTRYQTFLFIRISFWSSDWGELDFGNFVIKIVLNFKSQPGEREWSHVNKLTNQKQFWFLLSGGKNASFLTCWGAALRLPGCNSGSEPALLPFT